MWIVFVSCDRHPNWEVILYELYEVQAHMFGVNFVGRVRDGEPEIFN